MGRVHPDFAIAGSAIAALTVAWASLVISQPARADELSSSCPEAGAVFQSVAADKALDGTTFLLADGREVRLAGVVAATSMDGDGDASMRARAALDAVIAGKQVALHGRADSHNRYGMLIAQVAVAEGKMRWVQAELAAEGTLRLPRRRMQLLARSRCLALSGMRATERTAFGRNRVFRLNRPIILRH